MPCLSFIVCFKNTNPEYLESCLSSIRAQGLSDTEIILINDGSSAEYSAVFSKYDVKVFETGGIGTLKARILGVSKATSDYICFVDSDDTVSQTYHKPMLDKMKETGADMVINEWSFFAPHCRYYLKNDSTIKEDFLLTGKDVIDKYFSSCGVEHAYYVLWNKIIKKSLMERVIKKVADYDLGFCTFSEDVLLTYFLFSYSEKTVNVHSGYYFYRLHYGQETNYSSEEKIVSQITSVNYIFNVIEEDLKKKKDDKNLKNLYEWKDFLATNQYKRAKQFNDKTLLKKVKELYGVDKLKRLKFKYDRIYKYQKILPENFVEIDAKLKEVFDKKGEIAVKAKKGGYAFRQIINHNRQYGETVYLSENTENAVVLPKEKYSFKQKLIHNPFSFTLAYLLFPKGSKLRNFVKSKF